MADRVRACSVEREAGYRPATRSAGLPRDDLLIVAVCVERRCRGRWLRVQIGAGAETRVAGGRVVCVAGRSEVLDDAVGRIHDPVYLFPPAQARVPDPYFAGAWPESKA